MNPTIIISWWFVTKKMNLLKHSSSIISALLLVCYSLPRGQNHPLDSSYFVISPGCWTNLVLPPEQLGASLLEWTFWTSDMRSPVLRKEIFSEVASHYSSLEGWWVLNGRCSSSVSIRVCWSAYLWRKSSWQLSPMSSSFSTVSFIFSAGGRQMNHVLKVGLKQREKCWWAHLQALQWE